MISEATLMPLLAGESDLSEFDLSIQMAVGWGPEHQIRYFYFCLFRKVWSSQEWKAKHAETREKQEIMPLEARNLQVRVSVFKGQKLDLPFWGSYHNNAP